MRKLVFLLVSLLLAGCGLRPTPTPSPTPRPTVTHDRGVEYYPTLAPEVRDLLINEFEQYEKIPAYRELEGEKSLVVWPLISTGKFETIPIPEKSVELDVVWVIDYNHIKTAVQFPYVYGVWFERDKSYYLFANSASSQPIVSDRDEVRRKIPEDLPKGIPFLVRVGTFVERGKLDWEKCNYPKPLCDFGSFYNENIDFGVTRLFISRTEQRVPDWWFLYGWLYDNLGTGVRINLP